MLIRQGDERDSRLDRRLAFTLAAVAGAVNAGAFHAVGFFSANMTGNVSSLSSLIALGEWGRGLGYLSVVLTFIGGAMISALIIGAGLRRGIVAIYAYVVLAEVALLLVLGLVETELDRATGVPVLILGLSLLMGLQNAIVTHISDARVRTTHISGMATDVGIGIARLIDILRGVAASSDRAGVTTRLRLHAGTIAFFLAGGILGVLVYRAIGNIGFSLAGIPLAAVAVLSIRAAKSPPQPGELRRNETA